MRASKTGTPIFEFDAPKSDWEQWILWISDVHFDNPKCDRKLLKRVLDQAKNKNALIMSIGDWFCAMQGKGDKRANKGDLRPENDVPDYLTSLVQTSADYLEPYLPHLALFGDGNHETAVLKHREVDLTSNLVRELNHRGGNIARGGYGGYVQFKALIWQTQRQSVNGFYYHGSGGGGPVTKGVIQANRRSSFIPDAQFVFSGHIHESWMVEYVQHRCNRAGTEYLETQTHLSMGTMKEEYKLGRHGFHIEKGRPPKPLGGWWQRFYIAENQLKWEFLRAH